MNFLTPSEKPIATRTQAIVLIVCVIGGWGLAGPVRAAEALPKVLRQPLKMVKPPGTDLTVTIF